MYKELLEKIKGLRYIDKEHVPDDETIEDWIEQSSHNHTRNKAIDAIIKLIETYKAEELDMPNTEDWYWYIKDNKIVWCYQVIKHGNYFYIKNQYGESIIDFEGKWIKAELPKIGVLNDNGM